MYQLLALPFPRAFLWRLLTVLIRQTRQLVHTINQFIFLRCLLLKFCCVPATSTASSKGIFVAATYSTNYTNKASGTCHWLVYFSEMSMLSNDPKDVWDCSHLCDTEEDSNLWTNGGNINVCCIWDPLQGILTVGDGSVQLTTLYLLVQNSYF